MSHEAPRQYCSELARAAGATLIGSAEPVDVWILLEYGGTWRSKALVDNDLPPEVNAWLADAVRRIESELACRARLLFIRQPGRAALAPQLLVVRSGERERYVRQVELPGYEALLGIDAVALARDGTGGRTIDVPLYLVCTNGQRDLCCARFGLPVYDLLADRLGASVWQTTHVGGHRYAPNLICLPEGLVYGFAGTDVALGIVDATRRGEVVPANLRGRSALSPQAQVAELAAREHAGQWFLDAVHRVAEHALEQDRWQVSFAVGERGTLSVVVREDAPLQVQASCGDAGMKAVRQFSVERVGEP